MPIQLNNRMRVSDDDANTYCVVTHVPKEKGKEFGARIFEIGLNAVSSVSDEAAKFLPAVKCSRADSRLRPRNESGIPRANESPRRDGKEIRFRKEHRAFCFVARARARKRGENNLSSQTNAGAPSILEGCIIIFVKVAG